MDKSKQKILDQVKNNENLTSIGFGAVVVVIVGIMIFNFYKSSKDAKVSQEAVATDSAQASASGTLVKLPADHVVTKGEDLWKISEKYYKSGYNWVDIAKANKMANPGIISTGQKLTIPDVKAMKATIIADKNAPAAVTASTDKIAGDSYTITKGDDLWKIAVRAYGDGYAWVKIYKANPGIGDNPGMIQVGSKLVLPR